MTLLLCAGRALFSVLSPEEAAGALGAVLQGSFADQEHAGCLPARWASGWTAASSWRCRRRQGWLHWSSCPSLWQLCQQRQPELCMMQPSFAPCWATCTPVRLCVLRTSAHPYYRGPCQDEACQATGSPGWTQWSTLLQCLSTILEGTAWPTKHGLIGVHIDSPKIISEELCQKYQLKNGGKANQWLTP